ncbi:MAG: crossover junction endodeoxyribonuclease RuvC [Thermodesulfobacteriota bacterium]
MTKVLGIDPGLAETGVGIVEGEKTEIHHYSFGSIQTDKAQPLPGRLNHIFSSITSLLQSESPDIMIVEDVFSLKAYPASGIMLGQVTGIILLAGYRAKADVVSVPVREAKKVITGNGNAGKKQMAESVRRILRHETVIRPDHASDALALAIMGLFRYDRIP